MSKTDDLADEVEKLKRRVKELEDRRPEQHHHYHPYPVWPYIVQPVCVPPPAPLLPPYLKPTLVAPTWTGDTGSTIGPVGCRVYYATAANSFN